GERVWPGTWYTKGYKMIQPDLDAAGIPYVTDGPDGPRYADFHSLRHTYVASLDRAGATLKEAMQLARHSAPKLTMGCYGRAQLHDLGAVVGRIPPLGVPPAADTLRATGTDGPAAERPLVLADCLARHQRKRETRGDCGRPSGQTAGDEKTPANQGKTADSAGVSGVDRAGIEPATYRFSY